MFRTKTILESELNGAIVSSTPVQIKVKLHWAEELFQKCGLEEIADLVKPHLTVQEHQIFCQDLIESMTLSEIGRIHSIHISSVDRMKKRIRKIILLKIRKGQLLLPGSPLARQPAQNETHVGTYIPRYHCPWWQFSSVTINHEVRMQWQKLINQDLTIYHKPPHKPAVPALVCDCGHHFSDADRVQDPRMKMYRGYHCPYCNKKWPLDKLAEIRR